MEWNREVAHHYIELMKQLWVQWVLISGETKQRGGYSHVGGVLPLIDKD